MSPEHSKPGDGTRRLLAVEDDPDILRVIRAELERAGFEVWAAPSAEEGLAAIEKRGLPHLALVDILLPGMSGLELLRRLRSAETSPPVIVLGEETDVRAAVDAMRAGAAD